MKILFAITSLVLLALGTCKGQGNFLVDQQATNKVEGGVTIDGNVVVQSFTPTLSSLDAVFLYLTHGEVAGSGDARAYINIYSGSFSGPTIGKSVEVAIPNNIRDIYEFNFSSPVLLQPTVKYYFGVVVASGSSVFSDVTWNTYQGGELYSGGFVSNIRDLWFQEGLTVVPEPSTLWLGAAGALALLASRRFTNRKA